MHVLHAPNERLNPNSWDMPSLAPALSFANTLPSVAGVLESRGVSTFATLIPLSSFWSMRIVLISPYSGLPLQEGRGLSGLGLDP